jgi:hypothetical protein
MKKLSFSVSVLLLREENHWVAQCLEYDIAAQADTLTGVKKAFSKAFVSQVAVNVRHGKKPLEDVPKAPAFYRQLFRKGMRLVDRPMFALPNQLIPEVDVHAKAKEMRIAA